MAVGQLASRPNCLTVPISDAIDLDFGEVVRACEGFRSFFLLFVVLDLPSPGFQLSPELILLRTYGLYRASTIDQN